MQFLILHFSAASCYFFVLIDQSSSSAVCYQITSNYAFPLGRQTLVLLSQRKIRRVVVLNI